MRNEITDYEQLRGELEALGRPAVAEDRTTLWVVDRVFGIAKTVNGAVELFLVGECLNPTTALVKRHMEYGSWQIAEDHAVIESNRIVLPAAAHFLPLAAMIGVELVRFGLTSSDTLQGAFSHVEPLIDLALRQSALAEEHILGLVGELLCLEVMLDAVSTKPEMRATVLDMWTGHASGLRDFLIGDVAVEVKTTLLQSSSHKFTGLHQVEPSLTAGAEENGLFLLSVGLSTSESEGQSLSSVVQRILIKLVQPLDVQSKSLGLLQRRFLSNVAAYGSENTVGYDHVSMASEKMYNVKLRTTFSPRLYDLLDRDVRFIRARDLVGTCVSPTDLQFRLELPSAISPLNPVPNWTHTISELVRSEVE